MLNRVLAGLLLLSHQPTPEEVDEYVRGQASSGRLAPMMPVIEVVSRSDVELLTLYQEAYGAALYGFSCLPAAYPGGPIAPEYERLRETLKTRRTRVRMLLAERVGIANIDRVEGAIRSEAEAMEAEVHISCVPKDTARARRRYAKLLSLLERRLADLVRQ